jgi:hypothetical protein
MKSLLALLAATAAFALATPAGARPIDGSGTPIPSAAPAAEPAPAAADASGGGSQTWVVLLAAGVAFVAGAAGARLVAVPRAGRASA